MVSDPPEWVDVGELVLGVSASNAEGNRSLLIKSTLQMTEEGEFRCYIGGLAWSTSERGLKEAFEKFGHIVGTKVVIDKLNGRSRGFGFVTFDEIKAMEEATEAMNGMDLDGRSIIVEKAQPQGSGRDQEGDRSRDLGREYGGGLGSNGGECFKCGKPGHFARECPSEGGGGGRYGGRDDTYGGRDDRYGGRDDRYEGRDDRYGGRGDRYGGGGGGGGRYGPDRNGDRSGVRSRDSGDRGGTGNDRYNRDRSGPYEHRGSGNYR